MADILDGALDADSMPGQTPAQHDLLDAALEIATKPPVTGPIATNTPTPEPWSGKLELGNSLLLGGGTRARAGVEALQQAWALSRDPRYANVPFNQLLRTAYSSKLGDINASRSSWLKDNPGLGLLSQAVGGTIPTALAAATGQEYAVAPAARALTSALPEATPVVNFLTGALPQGASWLAKLSSRAFTGATMGALSGGMQAGMSDKPIGEQIGTGALTGGVLNPALGAAGDAIGAHIAPRVAAQAQTLMNRGVNLLPGQIPGAGWLASMVHRLGDTSGAPQRTQLTQALTRSFGEDSPVLDNQLVSNADARIGGIFKQFEGATIQKDAELRNGIVDTLADAHGDIHTGTGIPEDKLASLRDVAALISKAGTNNSLSGADYLTLTKSGSTLSRLMRDPDVGFHAGQLRDQLDAALERSVTSAGGRWVPAGAAAATAPSASMMPQPNRLMSPGGANAQPLLSAGSVGDIRPPQFSSSTTLAPTERIGGFAQGPGPAIGSIENGPQRAAPPGMVWQIDPQTQQALTLLRDARGQYKNLQLARGLLNDSTGEVQPKQLATRIAKFYPPNKFSAARVPSQWEQAVLDLAPASQFIPNGPTGAAGTNRLLQATHAAGGGAIAIAGEQLLEHIHDPMSLALMLGGTAATALTAKTLAKAANSPSVTARLLQNALRAPTYGAQLSPNMLLTPPVTQLYNRQGQQ